MVDGGTDGEIRIGGLLGRQVEGYDQRFITQTMNFHRIGATKINESWESIFDGGKLMILLDLKDCTSGIARVESKL